jgi:hypothetical protein
VWHAQHVYVIHVSKVRTLSVKECRYVRMNVACRITKFGLHYTTTAVVRFTEGSIDPHSTPHMADVRLASGTLAADRYYSPHLSQLLWGVTYRFSACGAYMRLINGFRKTHIFRWTLKIVSLTLFKFLQSSICDYTCGA